MSADEALTKAEELLERLNATKAELDRMASGEDAEDAVAELAKLAEIAKEVEAELLKARQRGDAGT